jgi:uncharacterized protein (TIGR03435 family)
MNLRWIGIALAASTGLARPQTEKTPAPKFEVASVRPNKSPRLSEGGLQFLPGGRFVATNIPLIEVIAAAWNLPFQSHRLTLAPGVRMPDDIYDIEATAEKGTFPPGLATETRLLRMRLMLRELLEDRFKLRIRIEPKEQPGYALVAGKGGPKLEKSKFQEQNCGDTGPKWLTNPACHFLDGDQDRGLHGASVTIAQVVEYVQEFTDRPLFDKTGLTGFYNIQTEGWAPMRVGVDAAPQGRDARVDNPERPTLFDVFEKLGLHMESQRAVMDMFVIDHVERPSENQPGRGRAAIRFILKPPGDYPICFFIVSSCSLSVCRRSLSGSRPVLRNSAPMPLRWATKKCRNGRRRS